MLTLALFLAALIPAPQDDGPLTTAAKAPPSEQTVQAIREAAEAAAAAEREKSAAEAGMGGPAGPRGSCGGSMGQPRAEELIDGRIRLYISAAEEQVAFNSQQKVYMPDDPKYGLARTYLPGGSNGCAPR